MFEMMNAQMEAMRQQLAAMSMQPQQAQQQRGRLHQQQHWRPFDRARQSTAQQFMTPQQQQQQQLQQWFPGFAFQMPPQASAMSTSVRQSATRQPDGSIVQVRETRTTRNGRVEVEREVTTRAPDGSVRTERSKRTE